MGSHGSNGMAERAVQELEGQVRVMKLGLEEHIGRKIDAEACIVAFLAGHAAHFISWLLVGKDDKTAYERTKGKSATVLGLEFGEKLLRKTKAKSKMDKVGAKWEYGIFVGVRQKSRELWIATPAGVVKARSVRRLSKDRRWGGDCVKWVRHVPWHLHKDQEDVDGDILEEKAVEPAKLPERTVPDAPEQVIVKTRQMLPRAFQIRKGGEVQVHQGLPSLFELVPGVGEAAAHGRVLRQVCGLDERRGSLQERRETPTGVRGQDRGEGGEEEAKGGSPPRGRGGQKTSGRLGPGHPERRAAGSGDAGDQEAERARVC